MSGMATLVYSISKHDPRMLSEGIELYADIQDRIDLKGKLAPDSRSKYDVALLSMARYLKSYAEANDDKRNAIQQEVSDAFMGVSFDQVVDEDQLYLVERIKIGDEVYGKPVNVWTADPRIFKTVLVRKLIHKWLNQDCLELIIEQYGLDRYYRSVKISGADDSEKLDFLKRFNHYLAEFYKRSDCYNQAQLEEYIEKSASLNALLTYFGHDSSGDITFEYNLKIASTLEQTESDIDDFCNNLKYLAKRMYEVNCPEDFLKSTTGRGKSHYSVKCRTYDKCLSIFDKYKKIIKGESIDDDKYGKTIDRLEGISTSKALEQKRLYRRKDIRKHYNMALELIQQSVKGYLT